MKQLTERCGVATPPKVMTPEFANSFVIGGKASKPFKKIPAKYQIMILVVSSVGDVTGLDYLREALEFFKCTNSLCFIFIVGYDVLARDRTKFWFSFM